MSRWDQVGAHVLFRGAAYLCVCVPTPGSLALSHTAVSCPENDSDSFSTCMGAWICLGTVLSGGLMAPFGGSRSGGGGSVLAPCPDSLVARVPVPVTGDLGGLSVLNGMGCDGDLDDWKVGASFPSSMVRWLTPSPCRSM